MSDIGETPPKATQIKKDIRGIPEREEVNALWNWMWSLTKDHLGKHVLEIGCGAANLAPKVLSTSECYIGVDYSEEVISNNRKKYKNCNNIKFEKEDIKSDSFLEILNRQKIDSIFCFNVLEHIKEDEILLNRCYSGLQAGGSFVAVAPAHPVLFGSSDKGAGHYRRYSHAEFQRLFEEAGFDLQEIKFVNGFGVIPIFLRNKIFKKREGYFESQSQWSLKFHDFVIPLLEFIESLYSPPMGASIFAAGVKSE